MSDSQPPGGLSARRKQVLLVVVLLLALALMMLAAEGAVRLRQTLKYGSGAIDHWVDDPKSGLRVPIAGFSSGRISINSLSFRGPEIAVPKPPGTVRIAFLGASTTWCGDVSGNEYAWPHLVTESLKRAFPAARFNYVNAGVPGLSMPSMLRSLTHRVAPLQPDVVVIMEGNDFSGEMRELAFKQGIISEPKMRAPSWPTHYSLLWNLVEKNLRILGAQHDANALRGRLVIDSATIGEQFRRDLTALVLEARKSAALVAVTVLSIQPRRDQTPEQQMKAAASAFYYMPFITANGLIEAQARYNDVMREVGRATGSLVIEGENDIPGDAVHFFDTVHLTDAGNRAMAQRVSKALIANAVLRKLALSGGR